MDDALANSVDRTSTRFFLSIKDRRAFKTASCRSLTSVAVSLIGSAAWGLGLGTGSEGCGVAFEAGGGSFDSGALFLAAGPPAALPVRVCRRRNRHHRA